MATRYTDKKKDEVVKFVENYDQKNGRGGQAAAKKKYGINPISIKKWCVERGLKSPGKSAKKVKKTTAKTVKKAAPKKAGRKPTAKKKTTTRKVKAPTLNVSNGSSGSALERMVAIQKEIKGLEAEFNKLKKSL